jgi:hypothetical protein
VTETYRVDYKAGPIEQASHESESLVIACIVDGQGDGLVLDEPAAQARDERLRLHVRRTNG